MDDLWFQKSNYPANWLSEKSNEIINKIKQKNMKNLIFTLLLPLISFSQTYYTQALNFQNNIRSFYDVNSLSYSPELALEAQMWADYMADTDTFKVSSDNYGENIFWADREYITAYKKDVLLEASMNWILDAEDTATLEQIIYGEAMQVGFGVSQNEESIFVVAKYDKLYE